MAKFAYVGKTLQGADVKGTLEAPSLAQANLMLKRQQVVASSVSEKKSGLAALNEIEIPGLSRGVTSKELVIFTRQFSTMIDAGLPLVQCLEILSNNQENPEFKKILIDVKGTVEGGSTFADSLKKHPKVFDELFINLVAAGEVGGILDTILNRLSGFMEKAEKIKGKVKSAMMYPASVIIIATLVVVGLLLWVVPIFEDMFRDFGQALPVPTQIVVFLSNFVQESWYIAVIAVIAAIIVINRAYKTERGRLVIDAFILKIPVFGDLIRKTAVARFTRTLSTMLSSGVPILEGLDIVSKTAGNRVIERAIMKCKDALSQGKTLAEPLHETKVFPGMVTQMISVGESTGALDAMLSKIADFYEEEVDQAVEALTSLIEPLLIAFLGVVVGGLVIALYLPIFQIAGAAST